MLSVAVREITSEAEILSIEIEGECDHAGAVVEMLEYSKPSWWADAHMFVNDDSEELPTLVCYKCGLEEIQEPEEPDYDD